MNGLEDRLTNDLAELADAAEFRPEGAAAIANSVRRRRQNRRLRQLVLVAAVGAVLGGFAARQLTDDEDISTEDDPSPTTVTIAPTTTLPRTTVTTDPKTETTTSTTAAAPPVEDQVALTGDGLGSVLFGDDYDTVVAAVEAQFGPAQSAGAIVPMDYPCGGGDCLPEFYAECTSQGPNRFERVVVWADLRLTFRGPDPESLVFKSWTAGTASQVRTPEGVHVTALPEVWQETYGDRVSFEYVQDTQGVSHVERIDLELRGTITGFFGFGPTESMASLSAGVFCDPHDI